MPLLPLGCHRRRNRRGRTRRARHCGPRGVPAVPPSQRRLAEGGLERRRQNDAQLRSGRRSCRESCEAAPPQSKHKTRDQKCGSLLHQERGQGAATLRLLPQPKRSSRLQTRSGEPSLALRRRAACLARWLTVAARRRTSLHSGSWQGQDRPHYRCCLDAVPRRQGQTEGCGPRCGYRRRRGWWDGHQCADLGWRGTVQSSCSVARQHGCDSRLRDCGLPPCSPCNGIGPVAPRHQGLLRPHWGDSRRVCLRERSGPAGTRFGLLATPSLNCDVSPGSSRGVEARRGCSCLPRRRFQGQGKQSPGSGYRMPTGI
mmetsp:Transcript_18026/g.68020  ORF Transcript_18026/g.68020 Transcript_18026/m.68020 type:complete len:314 (+) Transcript_18026:612-1553(+)